MNIKKVNEMKNNKELFINALSTLFYGGGSDAPSNIIWGCNELLNWYEIEFGVNLGIKFDEEDGFNTNFDDVVDAIRNS